MLYKRISLSLLFCLFPIIYSNAMPQSVSSQQAASDWHLSIGAFAGVTPKYVGANRYRLFAYPTIDVSWKERVYFSVYKGLGLNMIKTKHFTFGTNIRYLFGSDNKRDNAYRGLKNTDPYFEWSLYTQYQIAKWQLQLAFRHALTENYGNVVSAGFNYLFLISQSLQMSLGPSLNWGQSQYQNAFFGVDATQSQASGVRQYDPGSGLDSLNVNFTLRKRMSQRWSLGWLLIGKRYLKRAANSPIVRHKFSIMTGAVVNYHFM